MSYKLKGRSECVNIYRALAAVAAGVGSKIEALTGLAQIGLREPKHSLLCPRRVRGVRVQAAGLHFPLGEGQDLGRGLLSPWGQTAIRGVNPGLFLTHRL